MCDYFYCCHVGSISEKLCALLPTAFSTYIYHTSTMSANPIPECVCEQAGDSLPHSLPKDQNSTIPFYIFTHPSAKSLDCCSPETVEKKDTKITSLCQPCFYFILQNHMFVVIIFLGVVVKLDNINYSDSFSSVTSAKHMEFTRHPQELAVSASLIISPGNWSCSYRAGQCSDPLCCLIHILIERYHLLFISSLKIHRNVAESCLHSCSILLYCSYVAWIRLPD